MTTTRRGFIKALAAVAAALGLELSSNSPIKVIASNDERVGLLDGLVSWHQPPYEIKTRLGDSVAGPDLGREFPVTIHISLKVSFETAPILGSPVDLYWSSSFDGVTYDGKLPDCAEYDLRYTHYIGSLICRNEPGQQQASFLFYLPARYGVLIVDNQSGQDVHELQYEITPREYYIE